MGKKDKTLKPEPKVAAAGIGGATATVLVFAATQAGIDMEPAVAAAFVTVVTAIVGYFKTN